MQVVFSLRYIDSWTETVQCPLITRQHEHEQKAGYFKDFCNARNTWTCLKTTSNCVWLSRLLPVPTLAQTHPALTCKMHGCPWDVMEGGGQEREQVLKYPLTPSARRKRAIKKGPKEGKGEGWRVKSRVEEERAISADY